VKLPVVIVSAIVLLALAIFILLRLDLQSNAPQFMKSSPPAFGSNDTVHFLNFLTSRPFEGGKMCIGVVSSRTNWQNLVFDIENRRVLGQLTNGWPVMLFGDPPKLLCQTAVAVPAWKRFLHRVVALVGSVFGRRVAGTSPDQSATYWVLDLEKNTVKRLGEIPGDANFIEVPSRDFRYCYTARHGRGAVLDYYLMDLRKGSISKLDTRHTACGWWDNSRILLESTNLDFVLYDVRSKVTSPLVSSAKLGEFLEQNKVTFGAARPHTFFIWNGRENDFYLTDTHQKWLAAESALIKVERPDGNLKLLSPRFKFEWSDHFDPSGQLYLYSGRERAQGSDGVFLRHLEGGTNQVLVAPGTNNYHSIPRFYGNSVIYTRSNAIWRVGLDGSNDIKLFPPSAEVIINQGGK
jgi:hypothetical protein